MFRKILFPALLAAAFPALAAPTDTHERVLPNGLRVIVKEDHRAPVVTAQVSYKIGSADEIAGKTGLSHALEHMMFKGTKTVPAGEYTRRISALGGQDNAYTSKERTVYFVKIAAQHLPEVLKLEADRMANLNFSNDVFNNEMKVIREERRERTEDSPEGRLYENMIGRAWQKSPNKTGVIGTMKDLHALKADDLRRWYKQWYAPNNATLVVVGDVQPETVFAQAQQYFGSLKRRPLPARRNIAEHMHPKGQSASIKAPVKQPVIMMAWRVPHLTKTDDKLPYALDMLSNVLDGHSAARFGKNLQRGKQIAQDTDIDYSLLARSPQLWLITATPAANVSPRRLKAEIEAQIADIAANGVGEDELQRARTIENANAVFARDSLDARAELIGSLHNSGFRWQDEDEIRRRIGSVSANDIRSAAKMLTPQHEFYVELLPEN